MSRGLVVEYAGLPGAGKTTLAVSTRAALGECGIRCRIGDAGISARVPRRVRIRRRLRLATARALTHPVASAHTLATVRDIAPDRLRDALAGAVQWLAVQQLVARGRRTPGVTLLEEGPVQTAWTLGLRARGNVPAARLISTAGQPDLLVVVEAPVPLVDARLAVRGSRHSRTQLLPEAGRRVELERGEALLAELVACPRPLLRVSNDGTSRADVLGHRTARWVRLRTVAAAGG